ncbi:site-specific integrase [Actinophytocola gossypii]|uniref:Tyrosine-type recombinase/integrase family protein n=1 Tax=Actinophytocola gossypii TaxID=2812003 RepID=A0ABT2JIS4_9PSEU|nr:site-specific integrase [Actinophytocola gossypii]MCT2587792.1 tyrosine-type recombinase/integrase family protein [Actinophytocola gossypii]
MAYAEKRGNLWRARWRGPDGTLEGLSGFETKTDAVDYGRDREAEIRKGTYVDPRAGSITLTEWVNDWFPSLDLEPTTLSNYRYMIEYHILPAFGQRALNTLTTHEIAKWEKQLRGSGLSQRTAAGARSTLTTVLADAIPRHIQSNPSERKRGKGRKGQGRIARIEKQEKGWTSPTQALHLAERAAVLSGFETDFTMTITIAYTAMRWGEALGLAPDRVHGDAVDVHWKLYELDGHFYRGRPKDGSMRTIDLPNFLGKILAEHLEKAARFACTCRYPEGADSDIPWCTGAEYVFLGGRGGHFRRSNYGARFFRPAADGVYPERNGTRPRARMPVLVDQAHPWPGKLVPPWPYADAQMPVYEPPGGRGRPRPGGATRFASWLPIQPGLTPHGLRHGHQTWMDEAGIPYPLQAERMGHEVPGMRGVYSHVSASMREALKSALQAMWEQSLTERLRISTRSAVPILDRLLREHRGA